MAYVKLELLCKVMGEGSRIRSNIRMSHSTAISPLDRTVATSFACPQLALLYALSCARLCLVKAPFKRGSLTASCAVSCNKRSGGNNEKRASRCSNASRVGGSKPHYFSVNRTPSVCNSSIS